jgi:membrane-bound serine protease (ClpP class)
MSLTFPILLQLAGVFVIIAEVILPSGGILALLAVGIFGYSLYLVFTEVSATAGIIFAVADLVMIPILVIVGLKLLAKSPVTLRETLSRSGGVSSQPPELESFMATAGKALTDLRPSGVALLNGRRTDVVSRGEYIEKGSAVVVISVTGNQIVVKKEDTVKP